MPPFKQAGSAYRCLPQDRVDDNVSIIAELFFVVGCISLGEGSRWIDLYSLAVTSWKMAVYLLSQTNRPLCGVEETPNKRRRLHSHVRFHAIPERLKLSGDLAGGGRWTWISSGHSS